MCTHVKGPTYPTFMDVSWSLTRAAGIGWRVLIELANQEAQLNIPTSTLDPGRLLTNKQGQALDAGATGEQLVNSTDTSLFSLRITRVHLMMVPPSWRATCDDFLLLLDR